ncbi:MAG: hypothetical protein SNG27_07355 [Rikenellaceae bacterium]
MEEIEILGNVVRVKKLEKNQIVEVAVNKPPRGGAEDRVAFYSVFADLKWNVEKGDRVLIKGELNIEPYHVAEGKSGVNINIYSHRRLRLNKRGE